uniref:Uncharacterized protein n=1 Tax=Arundo donax TaxID=35708 RepID=A0A0A9A6F8_ARUDO
MNANQTICSCINYDSLVAT